MNGDLVEIPQFTKKVLRNIESSRATKDDRVRATAQGIILGNIHGIEDLSLRAPSSDGISDEEHIEGVWNSACCVLATAIDSACDPSFIARVRNEVTQFISAIQRNSITVETMLAGTNPFERLTFDEGYKEAHGLRHPRDPFKLKFLQVSSTFSTEDSSSDFLRASSPDTPASVRIPGNAAISGQARPFTPRVIPAAPIHGVDKRAESIELLGRANTNSNAAYTNGYILWNKIRTVVQRRITTQKQEMVETLHSLTSAGFYQRFRWEDWVLCTSSILNSLTSLRWSGTETAIVDALAVSLGDDVMNIQMRENLESNPQATTSFLNLIMWIDTQRERMRLGPIPAPAHPVVAPADFKQIALGHNFAAAADTPRVPPNPALTKNVQRRRFECFNCGSPDHKVSECPAPATQCTSCGGTGHAHSCPGRYNRATRRYVQSKPPVDPRMESIQEGLRRSPNLMAAVEKLIQTSKAPAAMLAEALSRSTEDEHNNLPWSLVGKHGKITHTETLPTSQITSLSVADYYSLLSTEILVPVIPPCNPQCDTYASVAATGTTLTAEAPTVRHDSCASRTYIAPNSPYFLDGYTGSVTTDIRLASGQTTVQVQVGTATIPVIADDGGIISICIPNAWEVPTFNHTLISQRELYDLYGTQTSDQPGDTMTVTFKDGRSTTLDVIGGVYQYRIPSMPKPGQSNSVDNSVSQIIDKLLSLDSTICPPRGHVGIASAAIRAEAPSPELTHWHHALGHVNYLAVIKFMDAHSIPVPFSDRSFARDRVRCPDCAPFKTIKKSIAKKSSSPTVTPGHTIYADQMALPGKLGDSVRGQYTTSVIFTDKATRFSRLYPMKTSAKTAEAYRHFVGRLALSPGYAGHRRLHTDRGSEFVNQHVRKVARDFGAEITNTGAECHERIGIVERRVRTIKESVGAALCGARLSRHFYAYVAAEVVRRRNHLPSASSTVDNPVTPASLLSGTPPVKFTAADFPVIGARCTAWHVRTDQYANRSEPGIYLGLDEESSGAVIYFPRTNGMTCTVHFSIDDSTCINEYVQIEVPDDDINYYPISAHFEDPGISLTDQATSVAEFYRILQLERNAECSALPVSSTPSDHLVAPIFLPASTSPTPPLPVSHDDKAPQPSVPATPEASCKHVSFSQDLEGKLSDSSPKQGTFLHDPQGNISTRHSSVSPIHQQSHPREDLPPAFSPDPPGPVATAPSARVDDGGATDMSTSSSPATRTSSRSKKPTLRYIEACTATHTSQDSKQDEHINVPKNLTEARALPEWPAWKNAMDVNIQKYMNMDPPAITLVKVKDLPDHAMEIKGVWAFSVKQPANERRARITAGGYSMAPWMYEESFAPVANMATLRLVIREAAIYDNELLVADSTAAFQNQPNPNYLYINGAKIDLLTQDEDGDTVVYRLNSTLQGQKDAAELFYSKCSKQLTKAGFSKCSRDPCLYYITGNLPQDNIYVLQYVDDFLISGPKGKHMNILKSLLKDELHCKTVDDAKLYLGMRITRNRSQRSVYLDQEEYITNLLSKYGMENCKPISTPMEPGLHLPKINETPDREIFDYASCIPTVLYISTRTRPDISFAIGILCRHLKNYGPEHIAAAKHLLRYLQGTKHFRFRLGKIYSEKEDKYHMTIFVDADHANSDVETRKSTTGYAVYIGTDLLEWMSRLQDIIASSSTYAEYIALHTSLTAIIHWTELNQILKIHNSRPVSVMEDNLQCIRWAETDMINVRNRAVEVKYHRLRHYYKAKWFKIIYTPTESMVADMFTKPLTKILFEDFRNQINVRPMCLPDGNDV